MADLIPFYEAQQSFNPAMPLDQVHKHPENYNSGADEALAESLDAHGFFGAIIVQSSTGAIVAGNSRYRTAKAKGAATLPVFLLDIDDDEARRVLAVDNQISRLATFDEGKLLDLLKSMASQPRGLTGTGFDEKKLAAMTRRQASLTEDPGDPNEDWDGMPDYEQGSKKAAFSVTVHFPTDEDADEFFRQLGRPKAKFLWWPESDGHRGVDHSEVEVEGEDE